jgi:hypothetical protein
MRHRGIRSNKDASSPEDKVLASRFTMVVVGFAVGAGSLFGSQPVRLVAALLGVIYFSILALGWRGYVAALSESLTRTVPPQRRHAVDLASLRALAKSSLLISVLLLLLAALDVPR